MAALDNVSYTSSMDTEESTNDHNYAGGDISQPNLSTLLKTLRNTTPPKQEICLSGDDAMNTFIIDSRDVDILASVASGQTHSTSASNKVKTNPVVNYDWENRYYHGNLVAVHRNSVFMAYVLHKGKSGGVVRVMNRHTAERSLLKDFTGRVMDLAFEFADEIMPAVIDENNCVICTQLSYRKSGGVVRVMNRHTAERSLLKDFTGRVMDLAFEFADEIMLAVIDETGKAFIYRVETISGTLTTTLSLQIVPTPDTPFSEYKRLIWCPYIPDDSEDSDDQSDAQGDESLARVLLITHGKKAEIWYIDAFLPFDNSTATVSSSDAEGGVITIDSHSREIADAAFAPDASAIATAGLDGDVKFFQADIVVPNNPRCLHQWQPHDGRPLSSICFLDDHKSPQKCLQFWKYCVTGADHNTELKVWTCQTWACLQTIRFLPSPSMGIGAASEVPSLQVCLDASANYLVLSDIKRKVLYVMEIFQEVASESGKTAYATFTTISEFLLTQPCLSFVLYVMEIFQEVASESGKTAYATFTTISEFLLTQPCLSFVIADARNKRFKHSLNDSHLDEITTGELENEDGETERADGDRDKSSMGVHIKMFSVHAKTIQELQIMYKTENSIANESIVTDSSSMVDAIRDGLSDLSMDLTSFDTSHDQHVLLTPDAFTTHRSRDLLGDEVTIQSNMSSTSSFTHVTPMHDELLSPHSLTNTQLHASVTPGTVTPSSSTHGFSPSHEITPSNDLTTVTQLEFTDGSPSYDVTPRASLGDGTPRDGAPMPQLPVTMDDAVSSIHGSIDSNTSYVTDNAQFTSLLKLSVNDVTPGVVSLPNGVDETDVEVAEVLAEDLVDEGIRETDQSPDSDETGDSRPPWPKPPDMTLLMTSEGQKSDVNLEATRLAELAIHSAIRNDQSDPRISSGEDSSFKQARAEAKWDSSGSNDVSKESQTEEDLANVSTNKPGVGVDVINQLQTSLSQILATVQNQQREVSQLRTAVLGQQEQQLLFQQQLQEGGALREAVREDSQPDMDAHLVRLEEVMASRVERILSTQTQRDHVHLEQIVSSNQTQTQERHDQLVAMVTQSLNNTIPHRVERALKHEVKNSVAPAVSKVLDPLKESLHTEMAKKLTATDSLLKDNINKMMKNKPTIDAIGQAAGQALQGPIQATYREAFQNVVIPSFEASCQAMYRQINETFQKGSTEYSKQLENHISKINQKLKESRDPLIHQLQVLVESFKTSSLDLQNSVVAGIRAEMRAGLDEIGLKVQDAMVAAETGEVRQCVDGSIRTLQESLVGDMRSVLREELTTTLGDHTAVINESFMSAIRSSAATPVPLSPFPTNQMAQISSLVKQGHMNAAFEQALSASNIDLVTSLCKLVDPMTMFNTVPCPLQQPVLLSLIQQLSADLSQDTELKHKYLSEAIMTLDPTHPITQEHLKSILHPLCQKLKIFTQSSASHPMAKALRMLLMAAQSLLNQ